MNHTDDPYNAFLQEHTFTMLHGSVLEAAKLGAMLDSTLLTDRQFALACSWFTSIAATELQFTYRHEIVAHGATIMPQLDGLDPARRDALRMISTAANSDYAATSSFIAAQIEHVETSGPEAAMHAFAVFRAVCAFARNFHAPTCDETRCTYRTTTR